jgi:hypothetical protein
MLFELHAEKIMNRCPPASPELAMAVRRQVPCIISLSGGLKEYVYQAILAHIGTCPQKQYESRL